MRYPATAPPTQWRASAYEAVLAARLAICTTVCVVSRRSSERQTPPLRRSSAAALNHGSFALHVSTAGSG